MEMRQLTDEEDKILEELSNGNLSEEERTKRVKRLKEIDKEETNGFDFLT